MMESTDNYFNLFLQGKYQEGLEQLEQIMVSRMPCSNLYLAKALHLYRQGHLTESLQEISHSLAADPLNYQAYFNLSSIMYNRGDRELSFKNLVCANSSLNVLAGFKTKEQPYLDRAIELSFNNKQAKALKSVFKLSAKKNIEALNQINYALYLDPSDPALLKIQKRVYGSMGMKQLKTQGANMKKKKYERLETTLQVPSEEKFQTRVQELMEEFNRLVKMIKEEGSYIVSGKTESREEQKNHEVSRFVREQQSKVRWVELKPVPASSSELKTTIIPSSESILTELSPVQNCTPLCQSRTKDGSTLHGSTSSERSQQSHNDSLSLFENTSPAPVSEKAEPLLQDISFNSLSKLENLSISNISQNSKIKLSKIGTKNVLDLSDCLISLLEQSQKEKNMLQDSLNLLNDSKDSLNRSGSQKVELKLPIESLAGLKKNEKIVLAIQRVRVNDDGQKEEVEELYEIVANSQGLQLRKHGSELAF